ncbi:MAG: hypothetical protein JSW20_01300 [Nitrospiraceae bacterium]|nr:MAG: hypothetical protein JSW20_01300 [Nitrospiraceae bacterium]
MKKRRIIITISAFIILLIVFTVFADTFLHNVFSGRVDFPKEHLGENLVMEDGQEFIVFRRLKINNQNSGNDSAAVSKVRFKFKSFNSGTNKNLSMIPAPFLIGMKEFHEKYWTFNENSGYFQGIYQWESNESAENYPDSFIYKLMTKRADPGTLSYEIIPDTNISEYIEKLTSDTA